MSFTGEMPRLENPADGQAWPENACTHCGTELREDQEWCLNCGTARTLIHRPPDWRIAAAVIAVVVGLVLLAFAIALVSLSGTSSRSSSAQITTASPAPAPAPPPRVPAPAPLPGWPVGLSGWTVSLGHSRSQVRADATARRLAAALGLTVGVLDTTQHPSMKPGYWVVFTGRYPGQAEAAAAAQRLQARGATGVSAERVAPPGGL